MTGPTATCELYLDGVRVPDTGVDLYGGKATALDGLTLAWGRDGPNEQPGPATLVVDVLDLSAAADWLTTLHVGSTVALWSEGHVPGGGASVTTYDDGSFSSYPDRAAVIYTDVDQSRVSSAYVSKTLAITMVSPWASSLVWLIAPPRQFSPAGELPNAWDDIPQARAGQTWRATFAVKAPPGALYRPTLVAYTAPYTDTQAAGMTYTVTPPIPTQTGTGDWQRFDVSVQITAMFDPGWLAYKITLNSDPRTGRAWQDQTGTWADQGTLTWGDPALDTRVYLDDLALFPPAETVRRVLTFSGAVSDVKAVPDSGGLLYTVTAADVAADLANKVIGDSPWPQQPLSTRADRIAQLAGITNSPRIRIDSPLGALPVSYRDVDAQPAYSLLQDLATTAGGVLWAATHAVTGPFLWMENPDRRAASAELTLSGGLITITGTVTDTTVVSACDVLLDGVTWLQDTQDVATVVAVTWQEQTLDDAGQPAPTDRTVTVTAAAADLTRYGTRRLSISTELVAAQDATNYANRALALARAVGWRLEGLTLDTGTMPDTVPALDDASRQIGLCNLLDGTTRMGLALTLVDMPDYAPRGAVSSYYLEGGRYSYTGGRWALELVAAPSAGQGSSAQWGQLDGTWRWNQWAPTLKWQQLYGVAP